MPNPYDITQVDIPGVYGAVQTAHMGRIQQMLGERQIQAADRQAERENRYNTALTSLFAPPSPPAAATGASGASGASAPTPAPNPVVAAYGGVPPGAGQPAVTPPGLAGANPSGTPAPAAAPPPAQASLRVPPQIAQQLLSAGPEGQALLHSINTMNDEQLASAQHRLQALAPLYARAAHIPYAPDHGAARRAFIQSVLPEIQSMGIDPQQATNWDPTDENLNAHMSFGQTTNDALEAARGHPMVVAQGGTVVDTDNLDANGRPQVMYESPVVNGPNGEPYARPQSMSQTQQVPPQPGEVRQTSRGPMRFRGGDYRNPANYDPVQGGASPSNGSGGFPG